MLSFLDEYKIHYVRLRQEINLRWKSDAAIRNRARAAPSRRSAVRITDVLFPDPTASQEPSSSSADAGGAPTTNVAPWPAKFSRHLRCSRPSLEASHAEPVRCIGEASNPGP